MKIDDQALVKNQKLFVFGVTLDRKLNLLDHCRLVKEKTSSELNMVKGLPE